MRAVVGCSFSCALFVCAFVSAFFVSGCGSEAGPVLDAPCDFDDSRGGLHIDASAVLGDGAFIVDVSGDVGGGFSCVVGDDDDEFDAVSVSVDKGDVDCTGDGEFALMGVTPSSVSVTIEQRGVRLTRVFDDITYVDAAADRCSTGPAPTAVLIWPAD